MTASHLKDDATLLAECDVETFRSSGPGGQNVNRRETAVRLRHRPSGIVVASQAQRSQYQNKRTALEILREKLRKRAQRKRPRVATSAPRSAKEDTLARKKHHAAKKQLRRKPLLDE